MTVKIQQIQNSRARPPIKPSLKQAFPVQPSAPPVEVPRYSEGPPFQFQIPLTPETNKLLIEDNTHLSSHPPNPGVEDLFAFPIVKRQMLPDAQFPQGHIFVEHGPHDLKLLKALKEAINTYGMHSTYVQGILQNYTTEHRRIPRDWESMAGTVLEEGQCMQFKTWWKEEAGETAGSNALLNPPGPTLEELIGAGQFMTLQAQAQYDDVRIVQVRMCCLRAWLRVEPPGKTATSFTSLTQSIGEPYTDFLSWLRTAI